MNIRSIMSWFNKILVPIDGSKESLAAFDSALELATLSDAKITVLHVIPKTEVAGPRTKRLQDDLEVDAKNILKQASERALKKKIKIQTKLGAGSPGIETLKLAESGKFDHIFLSSSGIGSAAGQMIGSVSNYILQKSKIPVYLVK